MDDGDDDDVEEDYEWFSSADEYMDRGAYEDAHANDHSGESDDHGWDDAGADAAGFTSVPEPGVMGCGANTSNSGTATATRSPPPKYLPIA